MARSGSSGKALALLGFILGAAGLGLAAYSFFTFQARLTQLESDSEDLEDILDEVSIRNVYYDELLEDWSPSAVGINETIADLTIVFEINSGEKAFFQFVTRVHSYAGGGSNWMIFRFQIDGKILNNPYQAAGANNQDETGQFFPLVLQVSVDNLSSGSHNLTVVGFSTKSSSYCRQCTLLAQTYV